jgi:tripartite-type tricarboxylate transporter receptor subunit TctC
MRSKQRAHFACALFVGAAFGCGVWSLGVAAAQTYPNQLVKLIVPFAPGSPLDITARAVGDKLSTSLKQPVVIENRVGAGGNIGTDLIAKSAPDGYALGMVLGTALTVNPSLYENCHSTRRKIFVLFRLLPLPATCWWCTPQFRSIQ